MARLRGANVLGRARVAEKHVRGALYIGGDFNVDLSLNERKRGVGVCVGSPYL